MLSGLLSEGRHHEHASPTVNLGPHGLVYVDSGDLPHGFSGSNGDQSILPSPSHQQPGRAQIPAHTRHDEHRASPSIDGPNSHRPPLIDRCAHIYTDPCAYQGLDADAKQYSAHDDWVCPGNNAAMTDCPGNGSRPWLPPNKSFRCTYVARQVAVKGKYGP